MLMISATSSGGVISMVCRTDSTIALTELESASRISTLLTSTAFGRPVARSRPFSSIVISRSSGYAEPASIFTSSAVRSPISILWTWRA